MAGTEQTRIEVLLDGRQASDQLKDLSKQAAALRMEMAKAYETNDAGKVAETEWELSKLDTRMKQLRKETVDVKAVLDNLSGATMSDLRQSIAAVDARLNSKNIKRNSEEWDKLTEVKRTLIAEQKKLRQEIGVTDGAIRKQRLSVADWVVSLGVAQRAFNGIKNFLRESLYSFNAFQKGVKGLSSLTGLTGNDLNYLSDQAKELSTSTLEGGIIIQQSATEIVDAYKMIGSQRPELLKNKEALNLVTQDAIILSEAAEMELQPASKALTNSLNQFNASADQSRRFINVLAAGSQAGAGNIDYLSQAIEKSGTTANLMGLQFEQLVALIETAAPKFSEAAVAGNSIDKVLLKMRTNQIGFRDGVFDMNTALDELADRIAKGERVVDTFGEDHAKMVEVLVQGREEFSRYQEAVSGTNKAIEQAATNTDTNDARLQQQKNRLEQLRIELGEKLAPLIGAFTSGTASLVKVLISAIGFFTKYGTAIAWVTAAITAQTVVMKYKLSLHSISEKLINRAISLNLAETGSVKTLTAAKLLLTNGIKSATLATKAFFRSLMTNPLGLIITAVAGLGVAIYKLTTHMSEAEKAQKRLKESANESRTAALSEQRELAKLKGELSAVTKGSDEYKKIKDKIVEKYGKYDKNLSDEIEKVGFLDETYQRLTKSIQTSFDARQYEKFKKGETDNLDQILSDNLGKIQDRLLNELGDELGTKYYTTIRNALLKGENLSTEIIRVLDKVQDKGKLVADSRLDGYIHNIREAQKNFEKIDKKAKIKFGIEVSPVDNNNTSTPHPLNPEKKLTNKSNKTSEEQHQRELENQQKYLEEILFQAKSALEQEDLLHEERLRKAGVWGEKEESLRVREAEARKRGNEKEADNLRDKLLTLEALQKTHQANLIKIEAEAEKQKADQERQKFSKLAAARNQELEAKRKAYEQELTELRIKNNEELANEDLSAKDRKALKEKHQEAEKELTARQTKELITLMQDMLHEANFGDIDLSGKIFTPEEKAKFEAEILKLRESLSKLNADNTGKPDTQTPDTPKPDKTNGVDVLGMSPDDWEEFAQRIKDGEAGLTDLQAAVGLVKDAWGSFDSFMAISEKKQLKEFEKNTKKKKAALDKQLNAGQISQEQYNARVSQLDAELEAKKTELEAKQAKRQKAISIAEAITNTAIAITAALKAGPILGPILASIIGAMGAAQVATIIAQPLPGAESGGFIDVVRSQDGKHFKAKNDPDHRGYVDQPTVITGESGREFVANDAAVTNPSVKPVLDVIDAAQKDGTIGRLDLTRYLQPTVPGRASGGSIVTSREQITLTEQKAPAADNEIKQLLRANMEMMAALRDKPLTVGWYGKGGIQEQMKKASKYERNIKQS